MSVQKWLTRKSFRIALNTLVVTLLVPVLFVTTLAVLILRQWSKLTIKKFHKDSHLIGERLHPVAQCFVHDHFAPSPRLNLAFCWFGEGSLSIESLREIFTNNILGCKVDDSKGSSKLAYAELTSQIINYGGYFYYKQNPNFNIKNYVRVYDHEHTGKRIVRENDLKKIVAHLITKGWPQDESPWEVLLINNYVNDTEEAEAPNSKSKTVIIFRFHHFLADSYSMQKIFKLLSTGNFKNAAEMKIKSESIMTWKRILFAPYLLPYYLAVLMEELTHQPQTSWSINPDQQGRAGRDVYQEWSGGIPLEVIKRIKNAYGVSFQAVLSCIVGGAIQKLMAVMKKEVSQVMPAFCTFPRPGHPGGLVNHWGGFPVLLPLGDPDPVKRLKWSEVVMHEMSNSPLPSVLYLLYLFVGMFPVRVTQLLTKTVLSTSIALSPFPMLEGVSYIGRCRATDTVISCNTGAGSVGAGIMPCSSYGKIRIAITIDQQVHSSEDTLARFDEFIQADIIALLKDI